MCLQVSLWPLGDRTKGLLGDENPLPSIEAPTKGSMLFTVRGPLVQLNALPLLVKLLHLHFIEFGFVGSASHKLEHRAARSALQLTSRTNSTITAQVPPEWPAETVRIFFQTLPYNKSVTRETRKWRPFNREAQHPLT